jgi:ABC-type glycerol-3-phosphate transport system substrate-binding protein
VNLSKIFKNALLIIFIPWFAWLLMPDKAAQVGPVPAGTEARPTAPAKYVIRFSPGDQYMPDACPFGMGKPLQGLKTVVAAFEKRFPDTRIEIISVPGVREYLVTQLSSGAAPDILNVNVEDVWVDTQKGWYVPLDVFFEAPNPFVVEKGDPAGTEAGTTLPGAKQWWDMFTYQAISRGKAAPDNKNYCLTYDMIETGIFYNKTLFDQFGLKPPNNWGEFIQMMERLKQEKKIPLLMNLDAFVDWAQDLLFDQVYWDLLPGLDLIQDPVREAYLQGYFDPEEIAYLHRKGFFTEKDVRFREVWRLMRQLKTYTNQNLEPNDLIREFVTQRAAMLWSASPLVYRFAADPKLGFEWGVFYLPRLTKADSPYAAGTDMCVIGGSATQLEVSNSAVGDTPENWPMERRMRESERLKRVIAFLQFICLPEHAEKIINEYACFIPNIVGVKPLPQLKDFVTILERRYTTTKWLFSFDLRFSDILRRMLALYLTDGIDLDEFLRWQIKNITAACDNLVLRKRIDLHSMDDAWNRMREKRRGMKDLPTRE